MLTLTAETVVSPKEKLYFKIAIVFAAIGWLILTIFTVGFIWPILAVIAFFVWLANGLLIASLKGDAVSVHPLQLGRLDSALRKVCHTLGQKTIPELYVIQAGGLLNAFATRHSGRHFVVIFSDMLEALGPDSPEMLFLLGHEVGHIQRNHLFRRLLLAPALFLPLLGAAYSRACESTCDRFGALACGDLQSAQRAMMILAGGKEAGREMDSKQFSYQNTSMRGFFVSWYELISGYPTLSRRVRDLLELETSERLPSPSRNPLAYLFSLVSFGGGFGGRGSFITTLIFFYFLFIFAATGLSQFSKARHLREQELSRDEKRLERIERIKKRYRQNPE